MWKVILSVDAARKLEKCFYLYSVISKNDRIVRWRRPCLIRTTLSDFDGLP